LTGNRAFLYGRVRLPSKPAKAIRFPFALCPGNKGLVQIDVPLFSDILDSDAFQNRCTLLFGTLCPGPGKIERVAL
jgi:hypothetical protein